MFFLYFSFSLFASIFVFIDSKKHQMPKWWAAIIFFAPITMIYYVIKTKQKKSLIPLAAFILVFILVIIGESFLYVRLKNKIIYSTYSPIAKEILEFTDELKLSVETLNELTLQLEDMTSVESSPAKINEVLIFVNNMLYVLKENDRIVKKFVLIINDYQELLIEERFGWLLRIEKFYNEPVVVKYLHHLNNFLEAFSSLLKYTGENFQEINDRNPLTLKNYDGYYLNYVRALESHNLIDVSRMGFQHDFLIHYPELEPYLPTILQNRFINIWKRK